MSTYVTSSKDEDTFWKEARHTENEPNCDVAVGTRDGLDFPYIRALRYLPSGEEITVNFRDVDPAILKRFDWFAHNVATKLVEYEKEKLSKLRHANSMLYCANKKVSNDNATMEAKLLRSKRTLSMLLSKVGTKTESSVSTDGELMSRLSTAVRMLRENSSKKNTAAETLKRLPMSCSSELTMLTGQLEKLNLSNEFLQKELSTLQKQQAEARKHASIKETSAKKKH